MYSIKDIEGEKNRKEFIINILGDPRKQHGHNNKNVGNFQTRIKCLQRGTKENYMHNGSFHEAIGPVLVMAQVFGLMPVSGVKGPDFKSLSFSWRHLRTIYALLFLFLTICDTALTLYWFFDQPIEFNNIDTIIFHISIVIVAVYFIKLAKIWPNLMRTWEGVEKQLPQQLSEKAKGVLAYKIKMITFVAMILSLAEHVLNMISIIHYANFCPGSSDVFESFFLTQLSQLFHVFKYNPYLAIIGKIHNLFLTFAWNFMDVFVMVISIGIASGFKRINDNLKKVKGLPMSNAFWGEYRINYRNLCILCDKVDDAISIITMVSFSNNLYFICIQLLKSMNKMPSFAHGLYFYFSLFFLIGRTLAVSLYAAYINDESKKPSKVFRCVPKESWGPEVKRFSDEVSNDLIALSGMKFFHITRNLVLTVAGTIVTYELVLIQFHEDDIIFGCGV